MIDFLFVHLGKRCWESQHHCPGATFGFDHPSTKIQHICIGFHREQQGILACVCACAVSTFTLALVGGGVFFLSSYPFFFLYPFTNHRPTPSFCTCRSRTCTQPRTTFPRSSMQAACSKTPPSAASLAMRWPRSIGLWAT